MANRIAVSPETMATTIRMRASIANRRIDFICSASNKIARFTRIKGEPNGCYEAVFAKMATSLVLSLRCADESFFGVS
jgi:hypothetical protein